MSNSVNKITANAIAKSQALEASLKSKLNLDKKDKATPVKSDGYMLPSRIFGSPKRYINNLKNDVVTIKKGAMGQANDHELGRLNDLAMKAGSLLLAAYLFTTKQAKTSKAMEFIGFGTFFASMALWPKLLIQAPIKARTGVDIHRKYVDSFGREKMFFQDPQYIPWSLMDQKEIDKMGDKLKIAKDTPNRNAVIQDTARKTAVQGNTLWMYTAGLATPLVSAMTCNALEPKVDGAIRNATLRSTQKHLEDSSLTFFQRLKHNFDIRRTHKFLRSMENRTLDSESIGMIAKRLTKGDVVASDTLVKELTRLAEAQKSSVPLTKELLERTVQGVGKQLKGSGSPVTLEQVVAASGVREVSEKTIGKLALEWSKLAHPGNEFAQEEAQEVFGKVLRGLFRNERPKVGVISETLGKLADSMGNLKAQRGIIDRFLAVRTKNAPGTVLGAEYIDFSKSVISALGLKPSKKLLTNDEIVGRIEGLVDSDRFEGVIQTLGKKIETFHKGLSTGTVYGKIDTTLDQAARQLRELELGGVADKLTGGRVNLSRTLEVLGLKGSPVTREKLSFAVEKALSGGQEKALAEAFRADTQISAFGDADKLRRLIDIAMEGEHGTTRRALRSEVAQRILGAESSLYRTMQTFDIFKRIKNGHLAKDLRKCGLQDSEIPDAIDLAKRLITQGTIVDFSDKAGYMNTMSGKKIHDAVMRVLFDDEAFPTEIGSDLLKARLRVYKKEMHSKIVDIMHRLEAPNNEDWLKGTLGHMQGATKHNLIGEPIVESVKNGVQNMKNSNKWLKIFGSALLVLVGITLIAGTQFGKHKKNQTEKVEKGEKTNG